MGFDTTVQYNAGNRGWGGWTAPNMGGFNPFGFNNPGNFAPMQGYQGESYWNPPPFVFNNNWQGFPSGGNRYQPQYTAPQFNFWNVGNDPMWDTSFDNSIDWTTNLDNPDNVPPTLDFNSPDWASNFTILDNTDLMPPTDGPEFNLDNLRSVLADLQDNASNIFGSVRDSILGGIQDTSDQVQRIRGDVYSQLSDAGINTPNVDDPFGDLSAWLANDQGGSFAEVNGNRVMADNNGNFNYTLDMSDTGDGNYVAVSGSGGGGSSANTNIGNIGDLFASLNNALGNFGNLGGDLLNLGGNGHNV